MPVLSTGNHTETGNGSCPGGTPCPRCGNTCPGSRCPRCGSSCPGSRFGSSADPAVPHSAFGKKRTGKIQTRSCSGSSRGAETDSQSATSGFRSRGSRSVFRTSSGNSFGSHPPAAEAHPQSAGSRCTGSCAPPADPFHSGSDAHNSAGGSRARSRYFRRNQNGYRCSG